MDSRKILSDNIKNSLSRMGLSRREFCQKINLKYSTVTDWINQEKYPRIDKIELMADFFGISTTELVGEQTQAIPSNAISLDKYNYKIPLLGKVAAGSPIYVSQNAEGFEFIDGRFANDGFEYFALRIEGKSMQPTIMDGDIVIVRQQETADNGQIAVVLIDGQDATAKEVQITNGGIMLIGHNQSVYTPHFYSFEEAKTLPVKIIGVVIEIRRKFY